MRRLFYTLASVFAIILVVIVAIIAKDTIEEKIEKLQERKINLSNNIVKTGENFINKMSKEEIMHLFD